MGILQQLLVQILLLFNLPRCGLDGHPLQAGELGRSTVGIPVYAVTPRSRFDHEVIVGALYPDFIVGIEKELDKCPRGRFRPLYGTDAPYSELIHRSTVTFSKSCHGPISKI